MLNLEYPRSELGTNSFKSDLIIPIISKSARFSQRDQLKAMLALVFDAHLSLIARRVQAAESSLMLLRRYGEEWNRFKLSKMAFETAFHNVFRPLGAAHSNDRAVKAVMSSFCCERWRSALLEPSRTAIQGAIHSLLRNFRDASLHDHLADPSDVATIRHTIDSYRDLDPTLRHTYVVDWETPFLHDTERYYQTVCAEYISRESLPAYLRFCGRLLDLEELVAVNFLHESSRPAHRQCINNVVIIAHRDRLFDAVSGFVSNLDINELQNLFRLFDRIQSLEPLREIFAAFTRDALLRALTDLQPAAASADKKQQAAFPQLYCSTFLAQFRRCTDVVEQAFHGHAKFAHSCDRIAREVLNDNPINPRDDPREQSANLVARYTDLLLTNNALTFQELFDDPMLLSGALMLFNFLASKDVFCKRYTVLFMNRLLKNTVVNRDAETAMVAKMRSLHDTQFAQQLVVMQRDVDQSRERYGPESGFFSNPSVPCEPMVLTASSWPLSSVDNSLHLRLPAALETLSTAFKTKFSQQNERKEIEWIHERSTAVVELRTSQAYQITMNHLQVAVFMAVAAHSPFPNTEFNAALELEPQWLSATQASLTEVSLLQQNPKTKEWRINPNFKAGQLRLNATVRFSRPVAETAIDPQIEEEREIKTQAAIVRIMKARRVLDHISLCDEVTKQTSRFFPQKIERIKRQIEKLITGQVQYLERVDNKNYKYVTGSE